MPTPGGTSPLITDLFAVTSRLDPRAVACAIPPECRRGVEPAVLRVDGEDEIVVECPVWTPRRPSRHFLPCVSVLDPAPYGVRFELSVEQDGAWSAWVGSATLGPARFTSLPSETDDLRCEVDVFHATIPASQVRLRIRLHAGRPTALLAAPVVATLSACAPDFPAPGEAAGGRARIHLPAYSQMEAAPALRDRICSPTSVAMVLGRWGHAVKPPELAAEVFHPDLDIYGIWPAAVGAAARRGVPGYLLRFPGWRAAAWCLEHGLPIVASLRYARGELSGAAVESTSGHLVVLTGYAGESVLVHDPAAPTAATVPRLYRLDEFRRVWLERSGVGYVFFHPDQPPASGGEG